MSKQHRGDLETVVIDDTLGHVECYVARCSCTWRSGIACEERIDALEVHGIHARAAINHQSSPGPSRRRHGRAA